MGIFNQRLLTPSEQEEIYPYRRVWRSFVIEGTILAVVSIAAFVVFGLLGLRLPSTLSLGVNALLIAAPVILWLLFSVWRERFVPEPRQRLIAVFVITALAANAFAIPFIEQVLQPDRWLPLGGAINRIVGYAFTVGIVQETTKYAVVRFVTWPDLFRTRLDGVAYCGAGALGYATVLSLQFLLANPTVTPDVIATQVFNNVALNLAASLIVSYGLAEVQFDQPTPFLMTITVALAALLNGVAIPVRAGLTNANFVLPEAATGAPALLDLVASVFSLRSATPKPILGVGFSALLLLAFVLVVSFLFTNAERQAREAAASREI